MATGGVGEEEYEKQGRPIFGKIWSYEELQVVERPGRVPGERAPRPVKYDMPKPANWPADTDVDRTSSWVFWLPEGWIQGVRTQPNSGLTLKCYFNPEGKRFWHKRDIEKFLGRELAKVERPELTEDEKRDRETGLSRSRMRYVTDEDAIPTWPEDEDDWLPKDWKIMYRQLPSGLHKCYIPPGVTDSFIYHKDGVQKFLQGDQIKLSPMVGSRPMAHIMKESAARAGKDSSLEYKPRAKPSKYRRHALVEDYEESTSLGVVLLPVHEPEANHAAILTAVREAGAEKPQELLDAAKQIYEFLVERGFDRDTEIVGVFRRNSESKNPIVDAIAGVYYRVPAPFDGRSCYQLIKSDKDSVSCRGVYIRWNSRCTRWQFGALNEEMDGIAIGSSALQSAGASPWEVAHNWSLIRASFGKEETAAGAADAAQT